MRLGKTERKIKTNSKAISPKEEIRILSLIASNNNKIKTSINAYFCELYMDLGEGQTVIIKISDTIDIYTNNETIQSLEYSVPITDHIDMSSVFKFLDWA